MNTRAHGSLDARSPFVLDTHQLGRRPGSELRVHRTDPAPAELGTGVVGVAESSPIELRLRLESVVEGVLVSGTVAATAVGECVRCLEPLERLLEVDVCELFAYPDSRPAGPVTAGPGDAEDPDGGDGETRQLDGELADLEPVVRDAVVLALPFQPVCREDCPGLCPRCGARLADDPGHAHEADVDPRWAGLAGLATGPDDDEGTGRRVRGGRGNAGEAGPTKE